MSANLSKYQSIEAMFTGEFISLLNNKYKMHLEHSVSHVLPMEEYAVEVGYIRCLTDIKAEFEHLLKAYFKNE